MKKLSLLTLLVLLLAAGCQKEKIAYRFLAVAEVPSNPDEAKTALVNETYIHADKKGLVDEHVGELYYKVFCLSAMVGMQRSPYASTSSFQTFHSRIAPSPTPTRMPPWMARPPSRMFRMLFR